MLRILVADDAPMVRAGLKLLLETHEGWNVCGEAGDGEDAVQKAFALNPDVVRRNANSQWHRRRGDY